MVPISPMTKHRKNLCLKSKLAIESTKVDYKETKRNHWEGYNIYLYTLLELKVTKGCHFRKWGENVVPNGIPGWHIDVKMKLGCLTGGFRRIKDLFASNWRKFATPDSFQLPWLTIIWPVAQVPLAVEKALSWTEQFSPEEYLRFSF